jgi:hypothetical protein
MQADCRAGEFFCIGLNKDEIEEYNLPLFVVYFGHKKKNQKN